MISKLLEIEHLSCGYDSEIVIHNINCLINEKEFLGVIGPNGSGKTTFLRALSRIIKPKRGVICFQNKNIWSIKIKELAKKIAVVSQNQPFTQMTVKEFVLLGRIAHYQTLQFFETKIDLDIAKGAMRLTDTLGFKNRFMSELSGGERQLVHIARALTQEPKLLLLDEPTTHLDISHQVAILDLIRKLNREFGLTVIMVLHDLNLASEYCDKLFLINKGRLSKVGPPQEVLTYKNIEEIYRTPVVVKTNPISQKPYVFLVSKEEINKKNA